MSVTFLAERDDAEMAINGGEVGLYALLHQRLTTQTVGNEVLDRDDVQAMGGSHLLELGQAGHGAIGIEYLYEGGSGLHT